MKPLKILSCLLVSPFLFSCNNQSNKDNKREYYQDDVQEIVQHEYDEVSDYEIVWDSIFDVDDEEYYVYFYSTTCFHCQDLKNYIIEKALSMGNIYFSKSSSNDQLSGTIKNSIGAGNPGDIWIIGYPSLIKIQNKKCVKNVAGNQQITVELK